MLFIYTFFYERNYTIFGEQVPDSFIDKVKTFRGDSLKIYRVMFISVKVWVTFHPIRMAKAEKTAFLSLVLVDWA